MTINLSILKSIKFNFNLGKRTWFGTGGNCMFFYEPKSINQLVSVIKLNKSFFPIMIIGSGSNLLVRDGGYKGLVIKLSGDFKKIEFDESDSILTLGAAVKDSEISKFCLSKGISGLEFLSGIPGTIGGNLKMNAGCYGEQISDKLIECTIIDENSKVKKLKKCEIQFSYRKSSFTKNQTIIEAKFKVKKLQKSYIKQKILRISNDRKKTQPFASRTGGSTFINPKQHSAWKLIDNINYRGRELGGAKVSDLHTNFLINYNQASSLDLEMLGEEIRQEVLKKKRIRLDWELQRIGKFRKI